MKSIQGRARYGDIPPNQTLYVNNLNEKIKIPELKCCIQEVFGTYGEVIDIIACGTLKKKGQAFVVFRDISCATNAMRALQGFVLLDKPMKIAYSKTKSDVVAQEDGTFKPRYKFGQKIEEEPVKPKAPPRPKAEPKAKAKAEAAPKPAADEEKKDEADDKEDGQPSNVLFVENLPNEATDTMLSMLFRQYPGFQEVRLIPGRSVAFVDYENLHQAGMAMQGLQGFAMTPEVRLSLSYARK